MKEKFILLGSLGLNLVLAGFLFHAPGEKILPSVAAAVGQRVPPALPTPANATAATNFLTNVVAFRWASVESDDYRTYIANLRALRCPERLIRDLLVADIEKLYRRKAAEFSSATLQLEPWAGADRRLAAQHADRTEGQARETEQRALVRELLGVEWAGDLGKMWRRDDAEMSGILGFLTDEKAIAAVAAVERASSAAELCRTDAQGIFIEEDFQRLSANGETLLTDLAQILTPDEFTELRLRSQASLLMLDGDLRFDGGLVTGAELREIARASLPLMDTLKEVISGLRDKEMNPDELARRQAAFESQLAQILGPARMMEYQIRCDQDCKAAWEFAADKNISKSAAVAVGRAFTAAERQAKQLADDELLTSAERRALLVALAANLSQTAQSSFGAHAEAYLRERAPAFYKLLAPASPESQLQ
ncbi:MAG: hypothetical protein RLZZ350_1782 [Verrucomicrobiota bacterium]|jgi:hypothetical protein